jgi:hypothetical protein
MKTKFGAIIVAGSGKVGGHVASHNRGGAYLRTKVTPVNPNTSFQAGVRNRLATIATSWKGLTAAQRLNWNAAVSLYKGTDIFGDIRQPSGFNLYQKLNNNLSRAGVAALTVPPLPVALAVITTGVLASVHAGAMTITFTVDPVLTGAVIEVKATPPMSPGVSFVKSQFRVLGLLPTITAHVATITTIYNAKFGAPAVAGQVVYVKLAMISNVTGQAGIPVIYSAVVS